MWPVARAKLLELPRGHWNAIPETVHSDATDRPLFWITLSIPCAPRRQESKSSAVRLLATRGAWFRRKACRPPGEGARKFAAALKRKSRGASPSVLEKYRDRLEPQDFDPSPYEFVVGVRRILTICVLRNLERSVAW
jgi:hypothetical protein